MTDPNINILESEHIDHLPALQHVTILGSAKQKIVASDLIRKTGTVCVLRRVLQYSPLLALSHQLKVLAALDQANLFADLVLKERV